MSETTRVDAKCREIADAVPLGATHDEWFRRYNLLCDFARELERELREANKALRLATIPRPDNARIQAERERDQLKTEVARWREMARELAKIVKQEYGDWNWRLDRFAAMEKGDE